VKGGLARGESESTGRGVGIGKKAADNRTNRSGELDFTSQNVKSQTGMCARRRVPATEERRDGTGRP